MTLILLNFSYYVKSIKKVDENVQTKWYYYIRNLLNKNLILR